MVVYLCENCDARNTRGGRCTFCHEPLGSIRVAFKAAFLAATGLTVLWIFLSWLTGMELGAFALVFGGLVSGAVAQSTGGRGLGYQAVASFFTVSGLAISDAVVVRMQWFELFPDWDPGEPLPPMLDQLIYQVQWDGIFLVFIVLGFVGGLWLWK